jgi:DNA-binding HxlR family transcriptional regulator
LRFCELERALEGISTRTLTVKLKKLEDEKIVLKTDDGYLLTKTGLKLRPVLKAMEQFGKSLS